MDVAWLLALVHSPWLLPALFLLVVGDAFLVVLPSETVVAALGALSAATGSPSLLAVIPVAALGAMVGDLACFTLGRAVGLERWGWQRHGRVGAAIARVRSTILSRTAVLIFTARYIPFARIAVNLTAGAAGVTYRRFLPLSALAGSTWACYNVALGAVFGTVMPGSPLLAAVCSIVVALCLGLLLDAVMRRRARGRSIPPA